MSRRRTWRRIAVVLAVVLVATLVVATKASQTKDLVPVCHRTPPSGFIFLEVARPAVPAHLAHGDGLPGGRVPGNPDFIFGTMCEQCPHP